MDKHHILPKYMGGSDTQDNLVEVTRTCHTMWHYANWKLWGNKEDYIAYRGLSGCIGQEELHRELSSLSGNRCKEEGKGIFAMSLEERKEAGSRGGKLGGKRMANYKWITDGNKNSRIPKEIPVPEGWKAGVTRKKPRTNKAKYGKREDFVRVQKKQSADLIESRLKDLERFDLTKRGSITRLSELWGVSRAQVKRYLAKMGV